MSRVLVIGNGAAGLFSSWLLARKGQEVVLVGRGTPSTSMSTGCIRTRPEGCEREMAEFLVNEHMPWAVGARAGLSKIGTPFRCWMAPSHSTWKYGEAPGSVTVVSIEGHPAIHVRIASSLLIAQGIRAEHLSLPIAVPPEVPLTAAFRSEGSWELLAKALRTTSSDAVLLPAMVPLREYGRLDALERQCGRKVLEAVTPLGPPGLRLTELMHARAAGAGVTIWDGRRVTALDIKGDTGRGATVSGGSEVKEVATDAAVIATGGPLVDGLNIKGRELDDPFGVFQVARSTDALRGGYASREGMMVRVDGRRMANAVAAGDCVYSERRDHGSGLAGALDSARMAVMALEGA